MKGSAAVGIAVILLTLPGCASFGRASPDWPWPPEKLICPESGCTEKEALQTFLQAHFYCRAIHNYYESDGNRASASQIAISTVGSLAGAVISPISSGDAAKAWSGLSGATNAMQASIKENFSGSISAKRTKAVLDATTSALQSYDDEADATVRVRTAIKMATACSMAPAKADSAALKALAEN